MLLKDCPVGSVVRLVRINGLKVQGSVEFPNWQGGFHVHSNSEGNFVIDNWGNSCRDTVEDQRYEFEIVHPASEPTPEPRITFTVGGQEFYVGQRVWSNFDYTCAPKGAALEVIGPYNEFVVTRVENTSSVAHMDIPSLSTTPPAPHEWKRGDWARHESRGVVFVAGKSREWEDRIFVVDKDSQGYHSPPSELTFISHSEPPE